MPDSTSSSAAIPHGFETNKKKQKSNTALPQIVQQIDK